MDISDYLEKKKVSEFVQYLYSEIPSNAIFCYRRYADRIAQCASILQFGVCELDDFSTLLYANFCDVRHCPICMRRRSLNQSVLLLHTFRLCQEEHPTCKFLFGTFTFPNCKSLTVGENVSRLSYSFSKLLKYASVKKASLGAYRVIECTYNASRDDYNLHLHAVFCVKSGYFTKYYIKHNRWLEMWQKAFQDDSITQVRVQRIKGEDLPRSAFELGKYLVKSSDFHSSEVLQVIHNSFHKRRLHASTGLIKQAMAQAKDEMGGFGEEPKEVCPKCEGDLKSVIYQYVQGDYQRVLLI